MDYSDDDDNDNGSNNYNNTMDENIVDGGNLGNSDNNNSSSGSSGVGSNSTSNIDISDIRYIKATYDALPDKECAFTSKESDILQEAVDQFSSKNKNKSTNWDILFGIYRRLIVALKYQQPKLVLHKRDAERLQKRYKEIKKKGKGK